MHSVDIYFEPVNLTMWNMSEKVCGAGHVEDFYATKSMSVGDLVLFYVGRQDAHYESGVYAWGTVVVGPHFLVNCADEEDNGRLFVDVRIDYVDRVPFLTHEEMARYTRQFRSVHVIDAMFKAEIEALLPGFEHSAMLSNRAGHLEKISSPSSRVTCTVKGARVAGGAMKKGVAVRHKIFGLGKVKTIGDRTVVVHFGDGDRTFGYPDAFELGYLELA